MDVGESEVVDGGDSGVEFVEMGVVESGGKVIFECCCVWSYIFVVGCV